MASKSTTTQSARVGIIGGGAAGVITAKCLRAMGHDVVVFEKSSHVGGVWKYDEAGDAQSSVLYKSLHTNLPTSIMQLKDFPFKAGLPSYPSHTDVLQYLVDYAEHFDVTQFVRLNSAVTSLAKSGTSWKIGVDSKDKGVYEEEFDRVVVCNGHFSKESYAFIKGIENFHGVVSHSRAYRTPESYKDKRVLVIGRGPSGQDISLELVNSATKEVIVANIGYDADAVDPKDKRILKPAVDHIAEDGSVVFMDGSVVPTPDEIMHCTGYLYTVKDFFPSELLYPKAFVPPANMSNEVAEGMRQATTEGTAVAPLFKDLFAIEDPTVAFVGLPFKNLPFLCFELQARWVARVFDDSAPLPSKSAMYEDFFAYANQFDEPMRKLHQLGARQKGYFAELAALSDTEVGEEIHEMYADGAYLRSKFPFSFRKATYSQDPTTGKWQRSIACSADPSKQLVKTFC